MPKKGLLSMLLLFCTTTLLNAQERKERADTVYTTVEQMPQYPGGETKMIKYMMEHLIFPVTCPDHPLATKIVVRFVVETDGSLSDITIMKSLCPEFDKEFVRLIQEMPAWEPAKQDGENVRIYYTIPMNIDFK